MPFPAVGQGQTRAGSPNKDQILKTLDVKRGVCVLLGDASGSTAIHIARNSEWTVFSQISDHKEYERRFKY